MPSVSRKLYSSKVPVTRVRVASSQQVFGTSRCHLENPAYNSEVSQVTFWGFARNYGMTVNVTGIEELYRQFAPDVYRFALYLTADQTLAEDITSETFVRVWTTAATVRMATVKAYLLAIARNLYVEEIRRRGRHTELKETMPDGSDPRRRPLRLADEGDG
jgi:hypothetical protein